MGLGASGLKYGAAIGIFVLLGAIAFLVFLFLLNVLALALLLVLLRALLLESGSS